MFSNPEMPALDETEIEGVPDHVPMPTANMDRRSVSRGPTACGDSRDLL